MLSHHSKTLESLYEEESSEENDKNMLFSLLMELSSRVFYLKPFEIKTRFVRIPSVTHT